MGLYDIFDGPEKRNLTIYIVGIMCYKFALETMTGCMSNIVLTRYKYNPADAWGVIVSVNYACQSIGSLLVAPLIKRWSTPRVLSISILLFGLLVLIVPILEGVTGGGNTGLGDEKNYREGSWPPMIIAFLFPAVGIFHGIVELIRRVIPRDIVGGDPIKLKKMDSTVHICYEVAGTSGALLSRYWIAYFNYGYSLALIPIFFTGASLIWSQIKLASEQADAEAGRPKLRRHSGSVFSEMAAIFKAFFWSVWVGLKLVCFNRSLAWLIPAYTLPLVLHRYLENVLFAHYANFGLSKGSYQQLLVSGSNFGELCGAFFVLMFSNAVPTPIPWLRLDAITLMIVWIFPFATPFANVEGWVWFLAAIMVFISFGWASGDVSLVAYVQSRLAKVEDIDPTVSPLGAVMAFLYVLYIIVFAIVNKVVGNIMDSYVKDLVKTLGSAKKWKPLVGLKATQDAMFWTGGVVMSVCAVIVLAATFIPRGSFALNPQVIDDHDDEAEIMASMGTDPQAAARARAEAEKDGKDGEGYARKDMIEAIVA
ncbi:hypothetical protein GGF32_004933 [Allomyces javanicus]|nr:hypothetical protein GGF32_004933 [Allomyces javanicus]